MIPKTVELGFFTFHTYGLILAISTLAGWYVAKKRSHLYKIKQEILEDWILIIPLATALAGARLYHVLDYWSVYKSNPGNILLIQNGGLGIWGWLIGMIFGIYLVCSVKKIKVLPVLDLIAPSIALGQAIGRIANWVNQEGFGPPTNLPWKVYINPENRPEKYLLTNHFHPTFFYEAILSLLSFLLLIYFYKFFKKPGQIFALYLIFYSTIRFFMEFYRIDTWAIGELKIAQVVAVIGMLVGTTLLTNVKAKRRVDTP